MSFYAYDDQLRTIDNIEFGILPNNVIKKMSIFGEDSLGVEVYDLYESGAPKSGSLIDPRFGPSNPSDHCATCGLATEFCVSHPGHITLAEPMFHRKLLNYVKKILNCICLKCSRILLYKNEKEIKEQLLNAPPKERLPRLKKLTEAVNYCQRSGNGCGTMVTKIKKETNAQIGMNYLVSEANLQNITSDDGSIIDKKKPRQVLTPEIIYEIFKNISNEDCDLMGIKFRPEDAIIVILKVSETAIRPSAKADFSSSSRLEDDLTLILTDIVKANLRLRKYKETPSQHLKSRNVQSNLIQCHIDSYIDSNIACKLSDQKGKVRKSLSARINGKEGRIRTHLMGKRVNYSGRTVITPDPTLDINELGMPIMIATNLTFPEIVTPYNIDKIQRLVHNGRYNYPGANFVRRISRKEEEHIYDLRFVKEKIELQYGDVVDRHLVTGDYVLLNRQPTLHKLSMMGHKIKVNINPNLETFRLNPNVTTPYNADFDGDEMNIHVPQSMQSMIEVAEIANAQKQIISPRSGSPAIGTVQDVLLGSYQVTAPDVIIPWGQAMNILAYTDLSIDKISTLSKHDISGTNLFSQIIPEKINLTRANIKISNGIIEKGRVDKSMIGPSPNGIIHYVWDQYGYEETSRFLNNVQRISNNFNFYNGFTAGIKDLYISRNFEEQVSLVVQKKLIEINNRITNLENNPNLLEVNIFEDSIFASLTNVLLDCSKMTLDELPDSNNFVKMFKAGSKGNETNLGQMCSCIGQQHVEMARPKKKCNGRALPYFTQNDDTALARGFIVSSFARGQTPTEFIFQNAGSRVGLMDTAIKTAESGYIQRKLIKALEDAMINYDSTVRSAKYAILQFIYGDDGLDCTRQYKHALDILLLNDKDLKEKYGMSNYKGNDKFINKLIRLRDLIRKNKLKQLAEYIVFDNNFMLPVNIQRIILDGQNLTGDSVGTSTDKKEILEPEYIIQRLHDITSYTNTKITSMSQTGYAKDSIKYHDEQTSKTLFKLALYNFLAPKICISVLKLNKFKFDYIVQEIIKSFNKSMVEPGEMVGPLAAQSIGEPTSQATLNTFHSAGIANKGNLNLGVPRIKEILNCSSKMKSSLTSVFVDKRYATDNNTVNKIASYVKYTNMKNIANETNIYYDPNMYDAGSIMEKDGIKNIFHMSSINKLSCQTDITGLPWLIRIVLNREKLMEKNITLLDIKSKFCDNWEKRYKNIKNIKGPEKSLLNKVSQCAILSTNENEAIPVIHIRLDMSTIDFSTIIQFLTIFVENFKLKGMSGVKDVIDVEFKKKLVAFDSEGNIIKEENSIITTDGVNLIDIRYLNGIDLNRTITNDIIEIYNKFGIEAARNKIINEIDNLFKSSNISFHHLSLLADLMTHTGSLTSIDRHGLPKLDIDPLARASFEKPIDQLIDAAVFGEKDSLRSVSSRIMTGLAIKGGTGLCEVVLDVDLLEASEYDENADFKFRKEVTELSTDAIIDDVINYQSMEDIFVPY